MHGEGNPNDGFVPINEGAGTVSEADLRALGGEAEMERRASPNRVVGGSTPSSPAPSGPAGWESEPWAELGREGQSAIQLIQRRYLAGGGSPGDFETDIRAVLDSWVPCQSACGAWVMFEEETRGGRRRRAAFLRILMSDRGEIPPKAVQQLRDALSPLPREGRAGSRIIGSDQEGG